VNFQEISFGTPISSLPIDPVNTTSSRNYYTYVTGGSWEVAASLEATKNKLGGSNDLASTDGGSYPSLYEAGNNRALLPLDYGDSSLVGYWNFEEATGTTVYDRSGKGANGTWSGTGTRYSTGKVGSYAGEFVSATTDYISVPALVNVTNITISGWFKFSAVPFVGQQMAINREGSYRLITTDVTSTRIGIRYATANTTWANGTTYGNTTPAAATWYYVTATYDGSSWNIYLNGASDGTKAQTGNLAAAGSLMIGTINGGSYYFNGSIDDLRIYNRALSAAEVSALYSSTR
jgi:hypothetical protein